MFTYCGLAPLDEPPHCLCILGITIHVDLPILSTKNIKCARCCNQRKGGPNLKLRNIGAPLLLEPINLFIPALMARLGQLRVKA